MLHGVCSSIGRASACDADGCGFESRHSPQGNVAESGLRHSTANREVLLKGPQVQILSFPPFSSFGRV